MSSLDDRIARKYLCNASDHKLNVNIESNNMFKNEFFPVISEADDIWYSIFKCYYEIIKGPLTDIQFLLVLKKKLTNCNFDLIDIKNRMRIHTELDFEDEPIEYMLRFSKNELSLREKDTLIENMVTKIEKNKIS